MGLDMEAAQVELDALNTLADEYRRCYETPADYAWAEGIRRPQGTTWTAWSDQHCEVLAADLAVRAGRLVSLLGVPTGGTT